MIAVPTNNLKSELVQKIGRDKVLEIPSFEDLPLPPELRQTIEKNYSMGFINDALESIKTYVLERYAYSEIGGTFILI